MHPLKNNCNFVQTYCVLKKVLFFIFALLLQSCQFFDKKVPDEKELLTKELKAINWTEVDEYPTVEKCDLLRNKADRKQCFFEFITKTVQQKLNVNVVQQKQLQLDTIKVVVTVFTDATVKFKSKFAANAPSFIEQKVDSILELKLIDFPKISPALKRGIPVKSQFVLPIILRHN